MKKLITTLNHLTLAMVVQSANSACTWIFHQPEFPKEAEKYKKQ